MKLNSFKHDDWTNIWSWTWSFLSCSHFGVEYTKLVKFEKRPFVSQSIISVKEGKSSCWIKQSDRNFLGNYLSNEVTKNFRLVTTIANQLKKEVDLILKFIDKNIEKDEINVKLLEKYFDNVVRYYYPHIYIKYVVDYLSPGQLEKYLPKLEEARVYAESVFKRTEDLINHWASLIAEKSKVDKKLILNLTYQEVEDFLLNGKMVPKEILRKREKGSMIIFNKSGYKVFTGNDTKKIDKLLVKEISTKILKGRIGFAGKVRGRVIIIMDPKKAEKFKEGDILVAGMTRPDYLPLMKKAAAFITDGGGILCHAAIVAREMKKPCIIATEIGTKFFKDGDLVEVDANKGIITILNKKHD